eukprot:c19755_g1_i2.p1 GENE.c19755_g1_i2~~c19755_g1_i2.p1  ORF type:complete len:135 (+),score=32.38 c19755_g1_i2:180-584(+)
MTQLCLRAWCLAFALDAMLARIAPSNTALRFSCVIAEHWMLAAAPIDLAIASASSTLTALLHLNDRKKKNVGDQSRDSGGGVNFKQVPRFVLRACVFDSREGRVCFCADEDDWGWGFADEMTQLLGPHCLDVLK